MVVSSYAADYFVRMLHETPEGQNIGIGYFRERGFSDATIKRFGLGYCTEVRDAFTRQALSDGYKEEFLIRTGLTIKRENGGYYDRFCGRVIFPIHSISGRVIAFGARTMRTDKKTAKYLNSPESEIYHKSDVLYGIYFAKRAITQQDCCILVEGYTDVISMHQAGIENVVASSGTSLTQGQIRMIARFSRNITIIYDGDSAGIKASLRGIDMVLKEGMNVRTVLLPDGEDPDSFARSHNASQVQDYILTHEEDFISFKIRLLMKEAAGDPIKRAALISDIVQSILLREIAMKRVGHKAGPEAKEFIRKQEIIQRKQAEEAAYTPLQLEAGSSINELEHELIKYLLKYGTQNFEYTEGKKSTELNVAEVIISNLDQNGITMKDPTFRKIYEEYKSMREAQEPIEINHFINHPDPEVCNAVVDLLTYDENYPVSKLWKRFDIVVESEQDRLPTALPRAVILYKSKVIDDIIAELRLRLNDTSLSEEEQIEITQQISILNQERTSISKKLERLIV